MLKIQKKASEGKKLSEKERKIYNFYLESSELYFEFIDEKLEEIKKIIDVDEINNNLKEKDKLYIINEKGEKELNFDNINKYLSDFVNDNAKIFTDSNGKLRFQADRESQYVISGIYALVYEEKIKKNKEFQQFKQEWVTKAIVNYYNDKKLVSDSNKLYKIDDKVLSEEVDKRISEHTKKAVNETLEKYLYKNYPEGTEFNNLNRDHPIITKDGRWIYPELTKQGEYSGAYSPYYNKISMEALYSGLRRGVYYHETGHGIQTFFAENYYQLGNKGYNDELVDVGRWFELNNRFIGGTESQVYYYNIRELDSMDIINSSTPNKGSLFNMIEENFKNETKGGFKK